MKLGKILKKRTVLITVLFAIMAIWLAGCGSSTAVQALPLEVNVQDAYSFYNEGGYILDVRTPEEWQAGHVPGATLIPLDELPARLSEVPEGKDVYVICRSGNRSAVARDILLDGGYETVTSVGGGFNQWVAAGYPVETGP